MHRLYMKNYAILSNRLKDKLKINLTQLLKKVNVLKWVQIDQISFYQYSEEKSQHKLPMSQSGLD